MNLTVKLAGRMLDNRDRAEAILRPALAREEPAARFARAREQSLRLLTADPKAEKIKSWRSTVEARASGR